LVIGEDILRIRYKHSNSDKLELASQRRELFRIHSYYAYQLQKGSFFFAMFTYMLFKITNIEPMVENYEIYALIAFVVLLFIGNVIYQLYMKIKINAAKE